MSQTGTESYVVPLSEITERATVGSKAANLAELVQAGFPVPDGSVVTTHAFAHFLAANGLEADATPDDVRAATVPAGIMTSVENAAASLGDGPFAVRSSGIAEDLPGFSFAGQYETVLNVGHDGLQGAVKTCWASAFGERAGAYRDRWDRQDAPAMAALVQLMVPAEAAGVAFTANPLTGDPDEVVISAVAGLGERLVSGDATADEWIVRGSEASCRQSMEKALNAEQARDVATVARNAERHFSTPQDVEWAIVSGQVHILQARPMTALPPQVEWKSPRPGSWTRQFRLGEWLPEPVTPLFESWLLTAIELGHAAALYREGGISPAPPYHVVVNGWYFYSPTGTASPLSMFKGFPSHPHLWSSFIRAWSRPEVADFGAISPLGMKWEAEILPRYKSLVANWEIRVEEASTPELIHMIDELADVIGEYLDSITFVGGFAWKVEGVLAKFYRKHVYDRVGRSPQDLVIGLGTAFPEPPPHAVQSLDWFRPPLGKVTQDPESREIVAARRRRMEAGRLSMEAACREALAGSPKLLHRFEELLALAHHYAVVREEQISWFTLAWPVMRRGVLRMGHQLQRLGTITREEDVFFITRSELDAARQGTPTDLREEVASRQKDWEWQRRLTPPLSIGSNEAMNHIIDGVTEAMRTPGADGAGILRGMPASPGRASGRVRIVRGPEDFGRFRDGEVLVAQSTAPAWTPLFGHASAVVTDGGTIAAHSSLVAREFGIPAVVGTGDATRRLVSGQVVTVDGSAGIVELLG